MDDRHAKILSAAQQTFAQYGIRKTTMGDVAQAAGVSRQTVYNAYASKEDLLRAVVRAAMEQTHSAIAADWAQLSGFEAKLDAFFAHGPLAWYRMAQDGPALAEMLEGINTIAGEELALYAAEAKCALVKEMEAEGLTHLGATRENLADFIYSTAINAKYGAKDEAEVRQRLALLKTSVLALLMREAA